MFLQWNFPLQMYQMVEKVYLSALCWKHTVKIQHCQHSPAEQKWFLLHIQKRSFIMDSADRTWEVDFF